MKLPTIPGPEAVLPRLSPLLPVVYQALEAGTLNAREFFDQRGEPVNASLYPNLVRYHAKCYLAARGHDAEFVPEELANNGLSLSYAPYSVRILKSDHGAVPAPGASKAKRDFYNQGVRQLVLPFPVGASDVPAGEALNLVVLWDVTPAHNLAGLALVCPKGGDLDRVPPNVYWRVPIPHPAETAEGVPGEPSGAEPPEDLDISLGDPEESGLERARWSTATA